MNPEQAISAAALRVANVHETVVVLASLAGVDGRSWLPLLRGESQPDRDFVITHVNTGPSRQPTPFPQRCATPSRKRHPASTWGCRSA